MNVIGGFKGFQRWLGDNVVGKGSDDYGVAADPRARDAALAGAATGAVVGATVGAVTGFHSQAVDTVKEQWVSHSVEHPSLNGYNHSAHADYSRVCHYEGSGNDRHEVCTSKLDGWYHRFSPRISERTVGQYSSPEFNHTKGWEPLLGGFVGAAGGALVGLGIGIGVNALRKTLSHEADPAPPEISAAKQNQLSDVAGGAVIAGGVLGAGIGAWMGSHAGAIEQAQQQVNARTWQVPVTVNTKLGEIPRDNYQHNWIGFGFAGNGEGHGTTGVYREVPQYNADGSVRMQDTSRQFETGRYGPVMGGILGGVVGAGAGIASGVALGLAVKWVTEKAAAQQQQNHGSTKPDKPPGEAA